jgi:hypothetical protein
MVFLESRITKGTPLKEEKNVIVLGFSMDKANKKGMPI